MDANDAETQAEHLSDRLATERTFDRISLTHGRGGLAMRLARATGIAAAGTLIVGSVLFWRFEASLTAKSQSNGSPQQAIPVTADTAQTHDVPVYVEGLGTVQAFNTGST